MKAKTENNNFLRAAAKTSGKKILLLACCLFALQWQSAPIGSTQSAVADDCGNRPALKDTDTPRFALLVGIGSYKHRENPPIPGAENDVELMKKTLVENYNFPDDKQHIVTLKTTEATRERITGELRNLIAQAKANAAKNPIIVFYFSGHGTQYTNQPNDTEDSDAREGDGLDEAIVPFDSRDVGVFDILDDEIDDFSAELAEYSSNILFVFDSCHSGTVSRNGGAGRETKPNPRNVERKLYARRFKPSIAEEAGRKKIVTLAAALPHQVAVPKMDGTNGLMTFYLAAALRRASRQTTYQELMREVRAGVRSENSEQHPFADGDETRFVLAEASNRRDASIPITSAVEDGKIKFGAGRIHGVQVGTQVAIYDKCATRFVGSEFFLAYASVSEVGERESIAVLPDEKTNPKVKLIGTDSRLVLTAPTFGGNPIALLLDDAAIVSRAVGAADVRTEIRKIFDAPNSELKTNRLLEITDSAAVKNLTKEREPGAILRLRGGRFGEVFPDTNRLRLPEVCAGKGEMFPSPDTPIFYLQSGASAAAGESPAPLFGRYFLAADAAVAAEQIIESVGVYTRQRNLINLENKNSSLNDRVELTLEAIPEMSVPACLDAGKTIDLKTNRCRCADGKSAIVENNRIPQNARFVVRLKNVSNPRQTEKLYVAALLVSGDGKINLVSAKDVAKMELTRENPVAVTMTATQPAGAEMLKVIITTDPTDLEGISWLETNAVGQTKGAMSPLGQLLNQSGFNSRGNVKLAPDDPNSWGVKAIEWTIADEKFTCACVKK